MFVTAAAVLAGLVLLTVAADQFVVGAARMALIRRVSPLLVGIVILGFGTSIPELLVSGLAAGRGNPEVAVGNIVGSNIANLSLLLGVGAIIIPIAVDSRTARREIPITIGATIVFALLVRGGLNRTEGAVLAIAMGGAMAAIGVGGGGVAPDPLGSDAREFADPSQRSLAIELGRTVAGLVGTVLGAQLLLWGALDAADRAGLSEGFVGATLVAMGTSLPELVTVVQSARRRETDLIVGNLLGSCMFNALGVGAVVGLVGPAALPESALSTVAPLVAVAVAGAAGATMLTKRKVERWEGILLAVLYGLAIPLLT